MRVRPLPYGGYIIETHDTHIEIMRTDSFLEAVKASRKIYSDVQRRDNESKKDSQVSQIQSRTSVLYDASQQASPANKARGEEASKADEIWGSKCKREAYYIKPEVCSKNSK